MDDIVQEIYKQTKAEFPSLLRTRAMQVLEWGKDDKKSLYQLITILGEEFGELCKALLEGSDDPSKNLNVRTEAPQTAAVAIAIAEQMTKQIKERKYKIHHYNTTRGDD